MRMTLFLQSIVGTRAKELASATSLGPADTRMAVVLSQQNLNSPVGGISLGFVVRCSTAACNRMQVRRPVDYACELQGHQQLQTKAQTRNPSPGISKGCYSGMNCARRCVSRATHPLSQPGYWSRFIRPNSRGQLHLATVPVTPASGSSAA